MSQHRFTDVHAGDAIELLEVEIDGAAARPEVQHARAVGHAMSLESRAERSDLFRITFRRAYELPHRNQVAVQSWRGHFAFEFSRFRRGNLRRAVSEYALLYPGAARQQR